MSSIYRIILGILSICSLVSAYPGPGVVSGDITAVHDPSALCYFNGKYYLFSTGVGIPIRTSTDRTNFKYVGLVWPNGASWTDPYTLTSNGSLWAPDCKVSGSQLYLYYSASTFGSRNSAIFFAKSSTGDPGTFTNNGLVISSSSSSSYNAIDPNLYIEGSNWYLVFGSWSAGIALVPLGSSTGKPTTTTLTKLASRSNGIEAPIIFKYGSYYYLFTSWDTCCAGTSSTYNIRVGRSSSISGTYKDKAGVNLTSGGGTVVLETHDSIIGPGGQSVYTDGDGPILVYHYYTSTTSKLGINRLDFSSGWPVVV
ncbi:glycoside hydrolase family 43 protein [Serendipita vermifera]|nr:glycoside hydrolase family 43 protein [Serendipita vermifera]